MVIMLLVMVSWVTVVAVLAKMVPNPVDIIGEIGDNGNMEFMIAFIKLTAAFGGIAVLLGWIIGTMQDRAFDREVEERVRYILNKTDPL